MWQVPVWNRGRQLSTMAEELSGCLQHVRTIHSSKFKIWHDRFIIFSFNESIATTRLETQKQQIFQVCIITVSSAETEQPSARVKERTLHDEEESATSVIRLL
jgi:hypothetical protein